MFPNRREIAFQDWVEKQEVDRNSPQGHYLVKGAYQGWCAAWEHTDHLVNLAESTNKVADDWREKFAELSKKYDSLLKREIVGVALPEIGDYVLATKYTDGDPGDAWGVGYYDGMKYGDRHMVKDGSGAQIRLNGFRRVGKITDEYGKWLMSNAAMLEKSPPGMINLWGMLNPIETVKQGGR